MYVPGDRSCPSGHGPRKASGSCVQPLPSLQPDQLRDLQPAEHYPTPHHCPPAPHPYQTRHHYRSPNPTAHYCLTHPHFRHPDQQVRPAQPWPRTLDYHQTGSGPGPRRSIPMEVSIVINVELLYHSKMVAVYDISGIGL